MRFLIAASILALAAAQLAAADFPARPNIIVMMVDDMGFSDLGCFGSEIATPHLDALAAEGVRLTNFYNTARCCPSRASILTGLYAQQTGLGHFTATHHRPRWPQGHENARLGYQGRMARPFTGLAHALPEYASFACGKNHTNQSFQAFGFAESGARFPGGAGSYFTPPGKRGYHKDFYWTEAIGDAVAGFIDKQDGERPFLIYWAPNAPHWPLDALEEDIAKYRELYKTSSPKDIALARWKKQKELGISEAGWDWTPPAVLDEKKWKGASARTDQKDKHKVSFEEAMAIYAAQVDRMDQNVGKVLDVLKKKGMYENTLFIFCSDNGCSDEGQGTGTTWATVSNTPTLRWKKSAMDGGYNSSAIVSWPAATAAAQRGSINRTYAHLVDILPTIVTAGGGAQKRTDGKGREVPESYGRSILGVLRGEAVPLERPIFIQHVGNCAAITQDWKLVCDGGLLEGAAWKLYDLKTDRWETNDVAAKYPEKVAELDRAYADWVKDVGAYDFAANTSKTPFVVPKKKR